MSSTTHYQDYWINPRIKIAALWASMLFVFAYVDLYGLFRSVLGPTPQPVAGFTIGQARVGRTVLVVVPAVVSAVAPRQCRPGAKVVERCWRPLRHTVAGSAREWTAFGD